MKRNIVFAIIFLTAAVLQTGFDDVDRQRRENDIMDEGQVDNPAVRRAFELMRMRDPATGRVPRSIRDKELAYAATLPTRESIRGSIRGHERWVNSLQGLAWSARGPANVGGRTRALAIDIANPDIILAGGVSGGMWRSVDAGNSWTMVTTPSDLHSVTCIAQDTRAGHTNVWYYGTGENLGNSAAAGIEGYYMGRGLFKSTDNGVNWNQLASTASGSALPDNVFDFVNGIVTDPSDTVHDVVYAATFTSIQRSTDGGTTWATVLGDSVFGLTGSDLTEIAVTSTGVLYATMSALTSLNLFGIDTIPSASRGIWRSTDGTTWTNITPAGWPEHFWRIVIGIAPSDEDIVYFLGDTPGSGSHILYAGMRDNWTSLWRYRYLSGDGSGGGGSWEDRTGNLPTSSTPGGIFAHNNSYDMKISVRPEYPFVVYICGVNMFRSLDGFATPNATTWIGGADTPDRANVAPHIYPHHHGDQHALVFAPDDPSVIYSGNDGGVYRTVDELSSITWTPLNSGYETGQFYAVAIDHATLNNDNIIGGLQDNGTYLTDTTEEDSPWDSLDTGDGGFCAIADGRTSYYNSRQNGKIFRRIIDDNGNQSAWGRVDPAGASGHLFIDPFSLDPNNQNRMYDAGGTTLWRNDDLTGIPLGSQLPTDVNWTELTNSTVGSGVITAIGVSKLPANRVYYGTSVGAVYRLDSADMGDPAALDITGGAFPAGAYVHCVAADPSNADRVLVVFSNYEVVSLFYTTNGGSSWTDVSGNLEEYPDGSGSGPSCRWALIIPEVGAFVGTSTGLYSTPSLDSSSTIWVQEGSTTIGNVVVDMMDVRTPDGRIVVATHGNGVYSATLGNGSVYYAIRDKWNLLSIPLHVDDSSKSSVFPSATSEAFFYDGGGYMSHDTLETGIGYWLKFSGDQTIPILGSIMVTETVDVNEGWNMVGSLSSSIPTANVGSIPGGIVTSQFFKYDDGYSASSTIKPGQGYWVKVSQDGQLILSTGEMMPATNRIRIEFTDELPPSPPEDGETMAEQSVPTEYRLEQNYPNPFNPVTTIDYQLLVDGQVGLVVLDLLGREVERLVEGHQGAGYHSVTLDASRLASGVYFYRLTAGGFVATKKLLIMR